jgi:hypothetical protein
MATGAVSVALKLDGRAAPSCALFVIALALWVVVASTFVGLVIRGDRWSRAAGVHGSLAGVAGTTVLATRFALDGRTLPASILVGIAAALWLCLLPSMPRVMSRPAAGSSFLPVVATQGLASAIATLANGRSPVWAADLAYGLVLLGVVLYAIVLARFDVRKIWVGRGDHWILGGAAAITALAAARLSTPVAWGAWGWAMLCLVPLLISEALRPRLGYDARRWATAFPVGMYAAAGSALADAARAPLPRRFAELWVWVGVAVWLLVALGAVRAAGRGRPS